MDSTRLYSLLFLLLVAASLNIVSINGEDDDDDDPVKKPTLCEVCKYLATELRLRLEETKSKEMLETGHGLERKKRQKYQTSELRLIEALQEPHICERILEYNVHKEKKGSLRFAKGRSETMETLHGLVNKGVKVDLGIPMEMWDKPSAEVTHMQRKCFQLVEDHEEDIEEWYYHHQDRDIMEYLCAGLVLAKDDRECLYETETPKLEDSSDSDDEDEDDEPKRKKKNKKNRKGETGKDEL